MTDGVLLVDIDSTIPNLALMHISTWKKAQGYKVGFNISDPAEVYASVVFDWNRHKTDGLRFLYPESKINIGGSGIDVLKKLPEGVDNLMPDYSLYPECDYDLGFTTRGCIRNCHFCIVPSKEGKIHINQHPKEFHDPSHKKAVFMDNNILAMKDWFMEVTDWCIANKIRVDFNQGLDVRLMDPEITDRLSELRPINVWRIAFDSMLYREPLENALKLMSKSGINLRNKVEAYVYVHDATQVDDAVERCNILRSYGIMPYPMFNRHAVRTQAMIDLKRWARPWIFYSVKWEDYKRNKVRG